MPHVQDSSGVSWSRVRYCGSNEGSTSLVRHPAIKGVRCGHLVPRSDERHAGPGGFSEVQMRYPTAYPATSGILMGRAMEQARDRAPAPAPGAIAQVPRLAAAVPAGPT